MEVAKTMVQHFKENATLVGTTTEAGEGMTTIVTPSRYGYTVRCAIFFFFSPPPPSTCTQTFVYAFSRCCWLQSRRGQSSSYSGYSSKREGDRPQKSNNGFGDLPNEDYSTEGRRKLVLKPRSKPLGAALEARMRNICVSIVGFFGFARLGSFPRLVSFFF